MGQSLVQFVQTTASEDVEHLKKAIQEMCVDESGEPSGGGTEPSAGRDANPDREWFVDIDDTK